MADFKRQATADLMQATLAGDIQAINKAVAMGADLDGQDSQGRTPLAAAAASNNLQALNRLLQHGAKASTRGGDGHTALFAAVSQGAQGTAKRLLQWGDRDPEELAAAAELAVQQGLMPLAALLLKRLTRGLRMWSARGSRVGTRGHNHQRHNKDGVSLGQAHRGIQAAWHCRWPPPRVASLVCCCQRRIPKTPAALFVCPHQHFCCCSAAALCVLCMQRTMNSGPGLSCRHLCKTQLRPSHWMRPFWQPGLQTWMGNSSSRQSCRHAGKRWRTSSSSFRRWCTGLHKRRVPGRQAGGGSGARQLAGTCAAPCERVAAAGVLCVRGAGRCCPSAFFCSSLHVHCVCAWLAPSIFCTYRLADLQVRNLKLPSRVRPCRE